MDITLVSFIPNTVTLKIESFNPGVLRSSEDIFNGSKSGILYSLSPVISWQNLRDICNFFRRISRIILDEFKDKCFHVRTTIFIHSWRRFQLYVE